jgi:hypothetical protein
MIFLRRSLHIIWHSVVNDEQEQAAFLYGFPQQTTLDSEKKEKVHESLRDTPRRITK